MAGNPSGEQIRAYLMCSNLNTNDQYNKKAQLQNPGACTNFKESTKIVKINLFKPSKYMNKYLELLRSCCHRFKIYHYKTYNTNPKNVDKGKNPKKVKGEIKV